MNKAEYFRIRGLNTVKEVSLETALRLTFQGGLPDGTLLYSEVGIHGTYRHLFIKNGRCYFEEEGKAPEIVCPSTKLNTFYNQGYLRPELCSFAFCDTIISLAGRLLFSQFKEMHNPFAPYAKDVSCV